jgi:signal transduction histidine kinase
MQQDEFSKQIQSLKRRVTELRQCVRSSDTQAMTGKIAGELTTALEEITVLEEQLVEHSRELAAASRQTETEKERYRKLFEFVPETYLVTDRRGVILEANGAAVRLL